MMRKFFLITLGTIFLATSAFGFEAISQVGYGWLMQKGYQSKGACYVGFEAPVVQKAESGYKLINQTTYLYSDFTTGEVQALRSYAINQKMLYHNLDWEIYLGLGGGFWSFTHTEGNDDQFFGSLLVEGGVGYKGLDFSLGLEFVPQTAADMVMPSMGVSISF